ncbi:ABC1 kinase family protein [Prochlorococcus sp. MIT 1223]|uniref:ABC1 kinase family protein n=1 Tax=Prochlorococcus sp. MIT 1223 TaxID=3096217 RepID=UPI002A7483C0|nr:AarF/UbiB family protein [Prochlorococcus sp. MIT 1223]
MNYNFERDLNWLIIRPWIWIPRITYIIYSLLALTINLLIRGSSSNPEVQKNLAKKIFSTLIDLGPCFIKVGQALSTRPDLLRRDWLEELTKLQDNLPAFDHDKAIHIIQTELESNVDNLFEEFPNSPIASASLGQVYKANLYGDYYVAVKVQRPNLEFIIKRDLVLIKILGIISSPILPLNLGVGLGEIIDEFGKSLFEEIDYRKEALNAKRFSKLFNNNPTVTVPKVEDNLSTSKVICTSWIDGIKISNKDELIANSIEPSSIIRTGVISGIRQLLEFGYFHADPHPGNMFALTGNTGDSGHLAYVDFGMMDTISEKDRLTLTEAIVNLINADFYSVALNFQQLGFLNSSQDLEPIVPVLKEVLGGAMDKDVFSFNFKEITNKFSELMFDYPFRVPARFALIIRAVISQEGLALKLDSNFQIVSLAYPYVAKRLLTSDETEMLEILLQVIFNKDGSLRVSRLENLFDVLIKDSDSSNEELLPVASASLKLILGSRGSQIRKNLLLSLIKDEKINISEIKELIKLVKKTFNPKAITSSVIKRINPLYL